MGICGRSGHGFLLLCGTRIGIKARWLIKEWRGTSVFRVKGLALSVAPGHGNVTGSAILNYPKTENLGST